MSAKVSEEEFAALESRAPARKLTLSEWVRAELLEPDDGGRGSAGGGSSPADDPDESVVLHRQGRADDPGTWEQEIGDTTGGLRLQSKAFAQ